MDRRRLARASWSDVRIVALILVCGSLVPSPLERRPAFERFGPDTVLHFLGNAAFAAALADALAGEGFDRGPSAVLAVCSAAAVAAVTGRLQRYVPGRAHERSDVVAGVIGACVGALWRATRTARRDRSCEPTAPPSNGRGSR